MPRNSRKQLTEVHFRCKPCRRAWVGPPARIEEDEQASHHPWRYVAVCEQCGEETEQAQWERALLKSWATGVSGPNTPEGIARVRQNLVGHPTPEETQRTRFNAMKHGMSAKVATYFPAKPDGYVFCAQCDVDREWCAAQPACVRQTEKFMLHQAAFESRDPKRLMGLYSDLHAAVFAMVQQMLQTIIVDGVKIVAPKYYVDKEGTLHVATYFDDSSGQMRTINEINAHPLIQRVGELISRLNLSLADMGMTVKVIEQQQEEMGELTERKHEQEQVDEFRQRQLQALEKLSDAVQRARAANENDPILVEHQKQEGMH